MLELFGSMHISATKEAPVDRATKIFDVSRLGLLDVLGFVYVDLNRQACCLCLSQIRQEALES